MVDRRNERDNGRSIIIGGTVRLHGYRVCRRTHLRLHSCIPGNSQCSRTVCECVGEHILVPGKQGSMFADPVITLW
jgi:hypothetical protein